MNKKIKVLTLSDNPLFFSGVGTQTKYFIDALLESGKFSVFSIGGQARPVKKEGIIKVSDDWEILPTHGYGTREMIQTVMRKFKPDILWFMTDPRFWEWLWLQDREIRPFMPMVYYHVWDNYPAPNFNKPYYESNDYVINMSKITQDMVEKVSPDVPSRYIPLTVNHDLFKRLPEEKIEEFRKTVSSNIKDKFIIFWNNRNGQRKLPGTLLYWYKEFVEKIGKGKSVLIMNTDPKDEVGTNIEAVMESLDLIHGEVLLSPIQVPTDQLVNFYNISDVTVNISHSEGFGLSTLESLACETPIIVNNTGGLQEQVIDGVNGYALEPVSKIIVGSLTVPYIYQDYCSKEDFINALMKLYEMPKEQRKEMGKAGREHVINNYNFDSVKRTWVELMENIYKNDGSWEDRKNYNAYNVIKF